jgi:hypothetical protein
LISHFPHRSIGGFRILCLWFCASEKRALDFASRLSKRSTWETWTTAYFRRLAAFEGPELQISIFGTTNNLCDASHTTCSVSAFFLQGINKSLWVFSHRCIGGFPTNHFWVHVTSHVFN